MTYPFVNFAIGKALNKEWEDCGIAGKPGSLATYGTVRTAINLSSDNYASPQTVNYHTFSSATDLTSWSMQVRFMIDGSPDGEIVFIRCHREDHVYDVFEIRVNAGALIVTHCIKSTNVKKEAFHDLGDATGGRVLTLEIRCNESTGAFETSLDGQLADRITSGGWATDYQFMGVYPGKLKIGNIDGASNDNRGNVSIFDFRFAPNTWMTFSTTEDTSTGNHTSSNLNVGSHPSSLSFDGDLIYVTPAVEVTNGTGNRTYSFSEGTWKSIVFSFPDHTDGLTYQGKTTYSYNGSTILNYGFDTTSTAPLVRVNYSISGGKYRIGSSAGNWNVGQLVNNPNAGIEIIDFEIPSSNFNTIDIPHTLGAKPVAGIYIDKGGVKHFFNKKTNMLKQIKQTFDGADYDRTGYCAFSIESATTSKITWSGSRAFIDVPNRRIADFKSPGIMIPFRDASRQYVIIASQPIVEYESYLFGQDPQIEIWEVTASGLTKTGTLNHAEHNKQIKNISIINDGLSSVKVLIMTKKIGWINTSKGETVMGLYNVSGGTFSLVQEKTLAWHEWLDDSNGTTDANSRQLQRAVTTKNIYGTFTVTLDSSNPPSTSTGGGGFIPPGGGHEDPFLDNRFNQTQISTDEKHSRKSKAFFDEGIEFSPSGATAKPVDFYISSFTGVSDTAINISNATRKSRLSIRAGAKGTYVNAELTMVPLEGSSYQLVNLFISLDADSDVLEQFLLDSNGELVAIGSSGQQTVALHQAHPGYIAGLNVAGENFVLESSYVTGNNVTSMGGLRLSRIKFTGKNGRSETIVRKELLATADVGGHNTACDIFYFDNRIWAVSAPNSVSAKQEIEIFTYNATDNKFEPIQTIPTWAYLKSYVNYGINGWHKPRFLEHDGKLMLAVMGIGQSALGSNEVYNNYIFEWNPVGGAFVEPELFVTLDHGMRAGEGKLILFAETDSVVVEDDLPLRSSRIRLTVEPENLQMIDLPWRDWPLLAVNNRVMSGATHIVDLDFDSKEIVPVTHGLNCFNFSAVATSNAVFMSCHDNENKATRAGEFGMYNTDEFRVPFYYNQHATANTKSIPDGAMTCMFYANDNSDPCVFTSNHSAANGTVAISRLSPNSSTVNGWQELSISGEVVKAKRVNLRNVNATKEMVAIGFANEISGWGANVIVAGFDANASVLGGVLKNNAGGQLVDFDVVTTNDSTSSFVGAMVTSNGYIQLYASLETAGTGDAPIVNSLPDPLATNNFGGTFDKFVGCRVFNDGEDVWVFGFARGTGETSEKKGHALVWKYNGTNFDFYGHAPWMHCVQMADRPFQYKGEWYWYAVGASDLTRTYPISDWSAEQNIMVMKWNKEIRCFTSSRFWSEKRPIHMTFPRFPNRDGKFKVHPTMGILSKSTQRTSAQVGILNYDKTIVDQDEWRFLHQPHYVGLGFFSDNMYYYGDTYSAHTCGNSSFGKGGNDFVLSIGMGDGFANPMTGFTLDPRWTSNEHPFVYNYNNHHYPMAVSNTSVGADPVGEAKIGAPVINGGTYLRAGPDVSRNESQSFVSPLVIPSVNRKATGKLYVECAFRGITNTSSHFDGVFYLEGANENQKFAVIRNSTNLWTTSGYSILESGVSPNATPKNLVIGLVFDYDDNRLEVYINGTYRSQKALPNYDMRIRGMMKRRNSNSVDAGLVINFGQIPFEHQPASTYAICGPTLGGLYPYNYTNKSIIDTVHEESKAAASDSTLSLTQEPGVVFINTTAGSFVLTENTGWDTVLDLDGIGGASKKTQPVVEYSSGTVTIHNDRWTASSFTGLITGIVAKPCYGVHVETIIGSGVPGEREFNMTLDKKASACLILPHTAGEKPYWCFFDGTNHYFVDAADNRGYSTTGWETTTPMSFNARFDGRFTVVDIGQTTAPNWNKAGYKTTFIFFAEIPGLVNIRAKSPMAAGFKEAVSLDTNPKFAVFAATGSSDGDANTWYYYGHGAWGGTANEGSTSWSAAYRVNFGTSRIDRTGDSIVRYGGGVFYYGGTAEGEYYPRETGVGAGGLKYFGVWFGDGPLIYAPKIKR